MGTAAIIQRRVPEPKVFRALDRYAGAGPLMLGATVGVGLLVSAALGLLFAPSLPVQRNAPGYALLVAEGLCGVGLALGAATRASAVILVLLGVVAMVPFSFESILEQVHILGAAIFLFVVGRGAIAIDRLLGQPGTMPQREAPAAALLMLRVAIGGGIAFGALTEKLLDPALAAALLRERPELNVLRGAGAPDAAFVYLAGLTELLIGVVIISGQLTRPVMAVGAILFTITLPFFGWTELLGHLPFYGMMFTLFLAPNADRWQVRRSLRRGRPAV